MHLTLICLSRYVRTWMQSTNAFSCTTEVRWFSQGKLLRVFELHEPLQRFLLEKNLDFANKFSVEKWVLKLAYLCDIFNLLNELNLSLQGKMTTVLKLADKVSAFIRQT